MAGRMDEGMASSLLVSECCLSVPPYAFDENGPVHLLVRVNLHFDDIMEHFSQLISISFFVATSRNLSYTPSGVLVDM